MNTTKRKSIAIIGEGETEWFYFDSLRTYRRYNLKIAPDFPRHSDIEHMKVLADKYIDEEFDYVICLVDMDRIFSIPAEQKKYNKLKSKKGVTYLETNPCTEFWFLLHFLPHLSEKRYHSQDDLIRELQKYMPGYDKTKHYFKRVNLYQYLCEHGDINKAMINADKLAEYSRKNPDDRIAYSEVQKLIRLIDKLQAGNTL
jgi:hypothetical protein